MSDLADLVRAGSHDPHPRRRLPRAVGLLVLLLVLVGLLGGVWWGGRAVLASFRTPTPDWSGAGTGSVLVQVQRGDSALDIADTLVRQDVVRSVAAFRKAADSDTRSRSVQPGFYRLHTHMSGASAVQLLLDPASRAQSRVTLPEGLSVAESLQKISEGTGIALADLQAAAAQPAALGLPAYAGGQLEGFLMPATYDVQPGTAAVDVLKTVVARYVQVTGELGLDARAAAGGHTPYQVLTTASLVEKETAFDADRPRVARVVYNRLAADMPLQLDSTVNYIRTEKKARLSVDDLKVESDYNTYTRKGLPPTPIDSPGEAALRAALAPEQGDYLYFVTVSKDGSSLFTADYNAFLAAKAKAKADGVY